LTETQFIEQNKKQWTELEKLLDRKEKDPNKLHSLFVKVSSDLAYASTFYPKRSVRAYLNQLTQRVFDSMEKKKTEWDLQPVKIFFKDVLPVEMFRARKALLTSFLVFVIAVLIGVVSTANDTNFPRIILGDQYINMTERNIDNNDPMAVYKSMEQSDMFFQITVNNIRVSFLCFIMGIFGALGTIIILLHNGIMLGAFQYFFYAKGLFIESFLTIWIHGTIEISAIIIAGTAGIVLGNGLLFPSTFDRGTSLQMAAKRSVRILVGTIPLFIIAGFLESFVTRLTDMPMILKIMIIGASLLFILGIYVVYPWWHHRNVKIENEDLDITPNETVQLEFDRLSSRSLSQNIYYSFAQFRINMGRYMTGAVSILMLTSIAVISFYQGFLSPVQYFLTGDEILTSPEYGGYLLFFLYWFISSFAILILSMIYREVRLSRLNILIYIKSYFINLLLMTLIPVFVFYFASLPWMFLLFFFLPPSFIAYSLYMATEKGWKVWSEMSEYYGLAISSWAKTLVTFVLISFIYLLLFLTIYGFIGDFFFDFISWHEVFSGYNVTNVIVLTLSFVFVYLFMLPLYFYMFVNQMNTARAQKNADDLWARFKSFGTESDLFEPKI